MKQAQKYLPLLIGLLVVGAVVYGVAMLWRSVKGIFTGFSDGVAGAFGNSDKQEQDQQLVLDSVVAPAPGTGDLSPGEAQLRASRIYDALAYIVGDREEDVIAAYQGCNGNDMVNIFLAFGNRDYYIWGDPKNMYQWFDGQLSQANKWLVADITKDCPIPYVTFQA